MGAEEPRAKSGPKPLPPEERRVLVAVRLPPASAERLRALALATGDSQSDVIAHALDLYEDDDVTPPKRGRRSSK